jgi:hypothetical protein
MNLKEVSLPPSLTAGVGKGKGKKDMPQRTRIPVEKSGGGV